MRILNLAWAVALEITLLAPAMAVLSAADSSEALGLGLQVRPLLWVPCTVLVPRPHVLRCHDLTAKWGGLGEKPDCALHKRLPAVEGMWLRMKRDSCAQH